MFREVGLVTQIKGSFSGSGDSCKVLKYNVTTSLCDTDTDNKYITSPLPYDTDTDSKISLCLGMEALSLLRQSPLAPGVHSLEGCVHT